MHYRPTLLALAATIPLTLICIALLMFKGSASLALTTVVAVFALPFVLVSAATFLLLRKAFRVSNSIVGNVTVAVLTSAIAVTALHLIKGYDAPLPNEIPTEFLVGLAQFALMGGVIGLLFILIERKLQR